MRLLNFLLALTLFSAGAAAEQTGELLTPDLSVLKQTVTDLCTKARTLTFPEQQPGKVTSREIVRLELADSLFPLRPAYVVQVSEKSDWYHASLTYLFVLVPEGAVLKPILVYAGGYSEREVSFELVSIGEHVKYPGASGTPEWRSLNALLVRDGSAGNGTSQDRLLLVHFDSGERRMTRIFDEVLSFTFAGRPYEDFRSTFEFKPKGSVEQIDDLVVTTNWITYTPEGDRETVLESRESVFHWNGKEYEGKMNVPEQAKWPQGMHEPPKILVDLTEPLSEAAPQ